MNKNNYIKRLLSLILAVVTVGIYMPAAVYAEEGAAKFNYKLGMDSDSLFDSMWGYSGGTSQTPPQPNLSKSYVEGKFGRATQITYYGFKIANAAMRYNEYVFNFKNSDITVGGQSTRLLDVMRDTKTVSMYVYTPKTVDHTGLGAAQSRTLEMIFKFNTTGGEKKYSKKFQLPNTGEWAYISIPTNAFTGNGTNMYDGISDESYTSVKSMSFVFPYKDYFGANPDDSTWETPWTEPLIIDEVLFDRSSEDEPAINPPSAGEELYHENANIKSIAVDGAEVSGFDPSADINEVAVPGYIEPGDISEHLTVNLEAPEIQKTNVNQPTSGAKYTLAVPEALPGQGFITVTSASGKVRKTYKISFTLRDGIRVVKDDIKGDISSSVTIPVINESRNGQMRAGVLVSLTDKTTGEPAGCVSAAPVSIAAGQTKEFTLDINAQNKSAQVFVVKDFSDFELIAAPFELPYKEIGAVPSGGALSGLSARFSQETDTLNISADAYDGAALIIIKNASGIICVRSANAVDGKISESVFLGDKNTGEMSVLISYGAELTERSFYNASEEETAECIKDYKALSPSSAAGFYKTYEKLLSVPARLWERLGAAEQSEVLVKADKNVSCIDEVRNAIERETALALVNKNDAEVLLLLFNGYNDILGFDTSADYYKEYVSGSAKAVLERVSNGTYQTLEEANESFLDECLIYAINNVPNYSKIKELMENNAARISKGFDTDKYAALSQNEKTDFLAYVSQNTINAFSDFNKLMSAWRENVQTSGITGSGSSGAGNIIVSGEVNSPSGEPLKKTVFSDVPSSHWAYSSVQALYVLNIIDGISEGVFGAEVPVTREQFVKILMGALSQSPVEEAKNKFEDVSEGEWYEPYVSTAAYLGIVEGIEDNKFGVGAKITRQDMAVLIARALRKMGASVPDRTGKFEDDGDISDYAKKSVYGLYALGLISGMDDGSFRPKDSATRAQSAKLLYDVYSYINGSAKEELEAYGTLYKKLSALGLMNIKKNASDTVTRGEFAKIMSAFAGMKNNAVSESAVFADVPQNSAYYNEVMFLYGMNIISAEDGVFRPGDPVTAEYAAELLVKALGYGAVMNAEGVEDYYAAAVKHKLLCEGLEDRTAPMSLDMVMKLIDYAKDADIVKADLSKTPPEYIMTDQSAIYYYHKIVTIKDILRSAGNRAADAGSMSASDSVGIGKVFYTYADPEAYKYLGYEVKAYYSEDDEVLKYVEPTEKNKVLHIDGSLTDRFENSAIYYFADKTSSSKRSEEIPKSARLMKNYNYVSVLDIADYEGAEEIILTDNNGDGKWETVNLIDEDVYFVNQISSDTGTIYDYYGQKSIKPEHDMTFNVYDINGAAMKISDIAVNDVLSVLGDTKGENYVIYVSRQRDEGLISASGEENGEAFVTVGDTKYFAADNMDLRSLKKLSPGNGVTVYLSHRGKIAHVLYNHKFSDFNYGYVVKTALDEGSDMPVIKLYTDEGALTTLKLATKASADGERISTAGELDAVLKNANIDTSSVNQLIRFKTNAQGEINEIKTAAYVDDIDLYTSSADFTRYHDLEESYYHSLYKAYVGYVRMAPDTIIITVPEDEAKAGRESAYSVTPFEKLGSGTHSKVEIYNMSEDKTAGVAVIHSDSSAGSALNANSTAMVIKSISDVLIDGETRKRLTVLHNGIERDYNMAQDCSIERYYTSGGVSAASVLSKGDIIRAAINGNEEICDYHKVFDLDNSDDPAIINRGMESEGQKEYDGSKHTLIAYYKNAENGNDDVLCGRIWQGDGNSAWFPGVKFSMEMGYAKEVHNNTIIMAPYPGSLADNKGSADRYIKLNNRRVYIIDEVNDEIKLGTPEDIISAQYAGEENASRIIAERHSDVASCVIIVKRR
ncbi:MAG: S-layer homology domain-containing protein [Clostridiales bacterium]|nr:S-layer homology domain-containing protein [Clostridiales bacterium]